MATNHFVNECNALITATKIFTEEWDNPKGPDSLDQYKVFMAKLVNVELAVSDVIDKINKFEKEILSQFKARIKQQAKRSKDEKSKS